MDDKLFSHLFGEALNTPNRDAFASDWALSSMWGEDADPVHLAELCGRVWDLAHLSVADIRAHTGLTQAAFAARYCVPLRTVQNWELRGGCPAYVRLMMARLAGMADVYIADIGGEPGSTLGSGAL